MAAAAAAHQGEAEASLKAAEDARCDSGTRVKKLGVVKPTGASTARSPRNLDDDDYGDDDNDDNDDNNDQQRLRKRDPAIQPSHLGTEAVVDAVVGQVELNQVTANLPPPHPPTAHTHIQHPEVAQTRADGRTRPQVESKHVRVDELASNATLSPPNTVFYRLLSLSSEQDLGSDGQHGQVRHRNERQRRQSHDMFTTTSTERTANRRGQFAA